MIAGVNVKLDNMIMDLYMQSDTLEFDQLCGKLDNKRAKDLRQDLEIRTRDLIEKRDAYIRKNNVRLVRQTHLSNCSQGENAVIQILDMMGLSHIKQYSPLWANRRRYDFYIPDGNILIEFDGEQHFKHVTLYHQTLQQFQDHQLNDLSKTRDALQRSYKIIRLHFSFLNLSLDRREHILRSAYKLLKSNKSTVYVHEYANYTSMLQGLNISICHICKKVFGVSDLSLDDDRLLVCQKDAEDQTMQALSILFSSMEASSKVRTVHHKSMLTL